MKKIKKRLTQYNLPVFIEPCEEGGFFGSCPTLPGCFVEADNLGQAISYLEDAISKFIQSYKERGDPLPESIKYFEAREEKTSFSVSLFLPVQLTS